MMDNGITILGEQECFGRVETKNRAEFEEFTLKPSPDAVRVIEELESASIPQDQRLGTFAVG
jgi:hypothetical protein